MVWEFCSDWVCEDVEVPHSLMTNGTGSDASLARSAFVPRYYFNLVSRQRVVLDREGIEVPDTHLDEAIARIIEQIRSEEPELLDLSGDWSIEVLDEEGRRVVEISL
jgi:hypothetical protein